MGLVRDKFFPLFSLKNSFRKNDYLVDCPELTEFFIPIQKKWAIRESGMASGTLRKQNKTKRKGSETFYGIDHIEMNYFLDGGNKIKKYGFAI